MWKKAWKYVACVAVLAVFGIGQAMGQVKFEESQSRIIEPKQDVFIKPLVAEIEIMDGQVRQNYGPYTFPIQSVETLTFEQLENFKTNALYYAARDADADIIVAATFNSATDEKGKNIVVNVSGFPGKYVRFRTASKEDGDYEWITTVYPYTDRINATGKTKALGTGE